MSTNRSLLSTSLVALLLSEKFEINGYKRPTLLGGGSYSTVWLGSLNSKCVAVKMFNSDVDDTVVFEKERKIAIKLPRSDFIVAPIGFTGKQALVYEYISPGVLTGYVKQSIELQEKPMLAAVDRLRIMRDIAIALRDLHNLGIIHGDIKGDNVLIHLVRDRCRAKLADFNTATDVPSEINDKCGTPYYMSPEVNKGKVVNSKIDIYSFGMFVIELMLSVDLFIKEICRSENYYKFLNKFQRVSFEVFKKDHLEPCLACLEKALSSVDANFCKFIVGLVNQCIAEDPKDRPTAQWLAENIHKYLVEMSKDENDITITSALNNPANAMRSAEEKLENKIVEPVFPIDTENSDEFVKKLQSNCEDSENSEDDENDEKKGNDSIQELRAHRLFALPTWPTEAVAKVNNDKFEIDMENDVMPVKEELNPLDGSKSRLLLNERRGEASRAKI